MSRSEELRAGPSDEEMAAIVAAVDALWPRPAVAPALPTDEESSRWRFSGRWWSRPVIGRRERP